MSIIWLLIQASWPSVTIAILAGILSGTMSARLIALINTAIDQNAPQSLLTPFTAFAILALIAGSLSQFLLINLAQNSIYQLRLQLSQRILSAPLRQLEQLGPSQLLAVLSNDIQVISDTVFILPFLCIDIAVIAGCLIYLGWLSGWVFLAVTTFLILAITLVQILMNYAYHFMRLSRKEVDQLLGHFRSITDGVKELKLHATRRQVFLEKDLQVSAAASRYYETMAFVLAALASSGGRLLFFVLIGFLLFGFPQVIPAAQSVLPAFVLTLTYLLGPIENLIRLTPTLTSARVSIQKVQEMGLTLAANAEATASPSQPLQQRWNHLELKQVVHTYHEGEKDHRFSVGPIDLTLRQGERVFLVGGNGSGKSTLAKLITGLYLPEAGKIYLNGIPITETNREWYRQHFSVVFSDYYLFDRLIPAANLQPDHQVQAYLEKLELTDKVTIQDQRFSTTALSQGQR
ncbi:MAG: cyclic peptide export ABC transporter, partial [Synechococcaceae cyanobacterium SM2_3_1]|nr:cyclic peptide export ABC transporter [Synechococcaceae cyanobacterium SM2_3_1]